jgi:perosamine synthetase
VIPVAKPIIGEEEKQAVLAVLDSGQLAQGKVVEQFEQGFADWIGVKHAIATSNGTTALHVALLAHGVGDGDEVITTPFTFIASANSILYTGAKPVFVDIDPHTFNIDSSKIDAAITERTKAILPVHLYGHPADMRAIGAIAERHHLMVIEDAAQAHGATAYGKKVGSFGTGCFSFYPTKNMTSGEGGMITTDDDDVADLARLLRAHGARERYKHEILAFNFRMTDIHAAIGLVQLGKVDQWNQARMENARHLSDLLCDSVIVPVVEDWATHVFHQYTIRIPGGRKDYPHWLSERGVGTGVHYPMPVHRQKLYEDRDGMRSFPNAEVASAEVLSLPVHPSLTVEQLQTIAREVKNGLESLE